MSFSEKIKRYYKRIREKHNLTFIHDSTYNEKWSFRLSPLNLFTLFSLYTILIIVGVFLLIRFTPLQGLFSTGNDSSTWQQIEENSQSLDSISSYVESNQKYLNNLMTILKDEPFEDSLYLPDDSILKNYSPDFNKSKEDSILRYKVENLNDRNPDTDETEMGIFFSPVEGKVSKSFNLKTDHLGVDVATKKDEAIKVCLDGTVIFSGWSPDDGNIIIVQHNTDLVSVYKHCSVILKNIGDKVQEGDPIGIVGNTGDNSYGPHLHFELWKKGNPINPQYFISF